jgi:DMSO/TMAO reductase YedYZ molybdopterin-dependent catalytic subunit
MPGELIATRAGVRGPHRRPGLGAYALVVVTARATDWGLALLVGLLFVTGVMTLFAGQTGDAWVFGAHGVGGFALAGVLGWKLRRVWRRLAQPARWDRRTVAGAGALVLVTATVLSGLAWSSGLELSAGGYNLLGWHFALGVVLTIAVAVHAVLRAKPLRRRDLAGRRQLLRGAALAAGSYLVWELQRPASALLGLRGARRRFTGSYEAGSFAGNTFPSTSWVADSPRPLPHDSYRLDVHGLVARPLRFPLAELQGRDTLVATLDCTGGFYTRQRWSGVRLARLLERAGPLPAASHVRVISHTGYRWSFDLRDARGLLLATSVGGEPLSHEHGAPARLVAPGRRGFQWVKWVVRVEVHDGPDPGAAASTVWSSFTPEGRGAA